MRLLSRTLASPLVFLPRLRSIPPAVSVSLRALLHTQQSIMGDLNNAAAAREHLPSVADPEYRFRAFPIRDDDPAVRQRYRPFLLDDEISSSDWIMKLELATAAKMVETEIISQGKDRLKVLVLYGSLRSRCVPRRRK